MAIKAQKTKVGEFINSDVKRDAVHVAVIPAVSTGGILKRGDKVSVVEVLNNGDLLKVSAATEEYVGIVDPYLKQDVGRDDKFWVFLKPNLARELRHSWKYNFLK